MPIPEISGLLVAANHVAQTTTSILKLVKDVETKQKIIELQMAILDLQGRISHAQAEHNELAKVKDDLERKLMDYQRWDSQAACYELKALAEGIFVYAIKKEHQGGEPTHYLCPNCFGEKKRSILQHPHAGYTNYKCHACKLNICPEKPEWPSPQSDDSLFLGGNTL